MHEGPANDEEPAQKQPDEPNSGSQSSPTISVCVGTRLSGCTELTATELTESELSVSCLTGSQLPDTPMAGSHTPDMEICEGGYLADKDLQDLVDCALVEVIKDLRKQKETNSVKAYTVTGKYLPKDIKTLKDQSVIIDRARDGKSGQGADMCQEEYLKKGLSKVATGKINSFSVFRQVYYSSHIRLYMIKIVGMAYVVHISVTFRRVKYQRAEIKGGSDSI